MWSHPFIPTARVLIEPSVWTGISKFRQEECGKLEGGGILLGYRREAHLHIVEATTPQASDRRSLFGFFRRERFHQKVALQRWTESNETMDYLGEWHTHPELNPIPSRLDQVEWQKIYSGALPMVFVILGVNGAYWAGVSMNNNLMRSNSILSEC
jgi:integrative and conjugative element protein (TIGR02256 family)